VGTESRHEDVGELVFSWDFLQFEIAADGIVIFVELGQPASGDGMANVGLIVYEVKYFRNDFRVRKVLELEEKLGIDDGSREDILVSG
jgi:hypothetical protein